MPAMASEFDRFAKFVATLGRGPGRSRALSREEAREAFGMVLRHKADPHQVGAFLMLLRFRGEDAGEISGMVEAARDTIGSQGAQTDLDWPSYGAGRTRGAPWFLLSALALARAGTTVLMHGSNEYSAGISVEAGLQAVGPRVARFTYLPLASLLPAMNDLLQMRRLFGLRSPVNTVARLLNPGDAPASVDGVFHPPYLAVHLGVAELLARKRLFVLKGGGGEAERVPLKDASALLWDHTLGRSEVALPAWPGLSPLTPASDTPELLAAVWRGEIAPPTAVATVIATIGLGLVALGWAVTAEAAERDAQQIWRDRLPT
ncbi:MAG TPA: glycosyl transferase family protein [Acetobacteraceae bacterium]|nr:glycosyl transferase family protein [Acetobacteraceae bacterium]